MKLIKNLFPFGIFSLFSLITSLLTIASQRQPEWESDFITPELILFLLSISLPYFIWYILKTAKDLAFPFSKTINITKDKYNQLSEITTQKWLIFYGVGILLGCTGLITIQLDPFGLPWSESWTKLFFQIWLFIFLVECGLIISCYINSLIVLYQLNLESIDVKQDGKIFNWPVQEVKQIYNSYFLLVIIAIFLYLMAVFPLWLSPSGGYLALNTILGRTWVITPAVIIILYFLLFSLRIRVYLPTWKEHSLEEINSLIKIESNQYFQQKYDQHSQSISHLLNLLNLRNLMQAEDIKVFNWKQILTATGLVLAPTVRVLFFPTLKEILKSFLQ